jgi:hypothetical protein
MSCEMHYFNCELRLSGQTAVVDGSEVLSAESTRETPAMLACVAPLPNDGLDGL